METWSEGAGLGYWATIGIMFWAASTFIGTAYLSVAYGLAGLAAWLALNLFVAYGLNQARRHSRSAAYNDHLNDERMRTAEEDLITGWEKKHVKA